MNRQTDYHSGLDDNILNPLKITILDFNRFFIRDFLQRINIIPYYFKYYHFLFHFKLINLLFYLIYHMKKIILATILIYPLVLLAQSIGVYDLRTEQLSNPIGLDIQKPRFSWKIMSDQKSTVQTAFEIIVATTPDFNKKSIVWNTKISTDQSVYNVYSGNRLLSNTSYFWKLTVWDNHGNTATESAFWHTGLLNNEWTAKWIAATAPGDTSHEAFPSPMFRKEFNISKDIKSATLFISSKGLYEAHINGKKVGDDYLTPGWTSYKNRTQYQAYDITQMIKKGPNAIGAILGKGWFKGEVGWVKNAGIYGTDLGLIAQLEITLSNGSKQTVNSDGSWTYSYGPILNSEIYHGEYFDARKIKEGWSASGFSEIWPSVKLLSDNTSNLIGSYSNPVRKHERIKPIELIITPEHDTVIDFGQNMVGWVSVKASGKAGTVITISHAEVLDKFGNFYIENLRRAKETNTYILRGVGEEIFEPHFTFQGFRYIKVQGYPGNLALDKFEGVALYSDMKKEGVFKCSNPLVNQLQHNIQWGQRGNFVDVPTDCPQRDERLGWTGDAQAFSRTAAYNFDVQNFFAKWLLDLAADQNQDGGVPHVIPNALNPRSAASTGWADASTIIPWNMYWIYGDTSFLTRQYPSMKKWVKYMEDSSKNYLWNKGFHFGDWLFYSVADDRDGRSAVTDKYLIAQCFFANSVQIMINAATVLNNASDVHYYQDLLEKVKAAFRKEYVTGSGRMISSTQTAYVLALEFDMLLPEHREYAAHLLVKNITDYNYHITTGFLGTPYICHVLSKQGYADVAYKLLLQETYPSWLYPVKMGATTIWERWDGIKPDSTFQSASMNSFNHYAYGAIGDWMYRVVCGIEISAPGYKKSIIAPVLSNSLSFASSSTITPYGEIKSEWKTDKNGVDISVEIPVNTSSLIKLPTINMSKIKSNDINLSNANAIITDKTINLNLGSGKYTFHIESEIK